MSIAQESVICRWCLLWWEAFRRVWHESTLGGWFHRRRLDFQRAGQTSWLCRTVAREGALSRGWEGSVAATLLSGLVNLPVTFARWLYRVGRGLWDGSVLFRGVTALGRGSWLLMGLFALLMLCAPHARWDNLYGFLGAAGILALFLVSCANRDVGLEVRRLGPYFAFYALFITAGLVLSYQPALSLRFYVFHLTCFFIVLVTVSAVRSYEQLQALLVCVGVGLAVAAAYGCYQGYVGVAVVASQQDAFLNAGMPGRVYSFFDNPNNFAELLAMFIPLVGALTLNARGWRGKVLGALALGVCVAAIGMTYSRSSWIGLALAVGVFLALLNWRFVPGFLILGLCALPLLPQSIWNRILTIGDSRDTSMLYRLAIYEDTGRLLRDHGLTGVGLGSDVMKNVFRHYPPLYDGNYPIHTHNNYFQLWGEVGIFGLLSYLALLAGQVKGALRFLGRVDRRLRRILAAALGGLAGILTVSLVEYTWFYPRNMFLFWLLFAVLAAGVKLARREAEQR